MKSIFVILVLMLSFTVVSVVAILSAENDCPMRDGKHKFEIYKIIYDEEFKCFNIRKRCVYCELDKDKSLSYREFIEFLKVRVNKNWKIIKIINQAKKLGRKGLLIKHLKEF